MHQKILVLCCWESWGVGHVAPWMLLVSYLIMPGKALGTLCGGIWVLAGQLES